MGGNKRVGEKESKLEKYEHLQGSRYTKVQ